MSKKTFTEEAKEKINEATFKVGKQKIGEEQILLELTKLFEDRLKVKQEIFEKKLKEKEDKIKNLQKEVKTLLPQEIDVSFNKDWHSYISKIILEVFTIDCADKRYSCPYCNKFEKKGYLHQLSELFKYISLPEDKFQFIVWRCDYADRFSTQEDHPDYSLRISKYGENYYYAYGIGINKFPAIDLTVYYKQSNTISKTYDFFRIKGLGQKTIIGKDGEYKEKILFGEFLESIIKFFKTYNLETDKVSLHKKDSEENDALIDIARKKNYL